jgi:hypothetical protein
MVLGPFENMTNLVLDPQPLPLPLPLPMPLPMPLPLCRYRFSASYCSQCCWLYCKVMTDISTYMSLTLARLCGEWRLVSGNYEARGASGGKYEAQIVIFCILATVNRFSRISQKAESHWGKLESRWRNQKAVEEGGKPLKKIEFRVREIGF